MTDVPCNLVQPDVDVPPDAESAPKPDVQPESTAGQTNPCKETEDLQLTQDRLQKCLDSQDVTQLMEKLTNLSQQ